MVHQINGDLLENVSNGFLDFAVHQVNCKGRMGSGIAREVKARWPLVYTMYMQKIKTTQNAVDLLGTIQTICVNTDEAHRQYVINFFSQYDYGRDHRRYTYYDAFWNCLMLLTRHMPKNSKVGFPKGIGCGLGGGNWQVIQTMIQEVLGQNFDVYIYDLGGKK